jgi:hypothetical protein
MDGEDLQFAIQNYLEKGDNGVDWPCWELNDHDTVDSQGDSGKFLITNLKKLFPTIL